MKLMDISALNTISTILDGVDIGDSVLSCRIEVYTCKETGNDKKLHASLELQLQEQLSQNDDSSTSPVGSLTNRLNRKTFIYLVMALNCAFPDYDFIDTKPDQFRKEPSIHLAVNSISSILSSVTSLTEDIKTKFWSTIDSEIGIQNCEVYSFIPDPDSNPFDEDGCNVWSCNYFFYNRKLKRILFIACYAQHKLSQDDGSVLVEMIDAESNTKKYQTWIYDEMEVN
ncbi:repressor of RNA polymerase III transcription-like [Schistocerca gregaria]|uniref:repressor of RNA polymerase III transcription-like n=1 Tax=Schistocerca gregaria TaxID=7010 RepID=UPI00211EA096|nr:repressor of RNA polymerase III transcription-like [Schistocerca gregaria]